jgi:hypothetical protein
MGNCNMKLLAAVGLALAGCIDSSDTEARLALSDCIDPSHTEQAVSSEPDQVLAWNVTALKVWVGPQNPFFAFRWLPLLHGSIFDAVNGVTGDYEPFIVDESAPDGATANAAAAGAGHYIVTHLDYVPPLTPEQLQIIAEHLNSLPTSITGNPGFAYGADVAAQVLASRADDGAPGPTELLTIYNPPCAGQPGCWEAQPTPTGGPAPALGVTWGDQRTWVLNHARQFYPEPPPALDSEVYLTDLAEVESVGYRFSMTRTTTQTNIATFWVGTSFGIWNPIARRTSEAHGYSVSQNARLFAVLNVAAADAYISTWHIKFDFNFWRPITAIQVTFGNASWLPLLPATPPFPEYTSGHTSGSGAYAAVLANEFGDDPGDPILAQSPTNTGFDHYWQTFSEGVDEVIDARVYSGIHFRNSDVVGARVGGKIGKYVVKHAMRANHGHAKHKHKGHGTSQK